jgi:hypothetical protein
MPSKNAPTHPNARHQAQKSTKIFHPPHKALIFNRLQLNIVKNPKPKLFSV